MPRRELLTEPQRLAFTEPAIDEREMAHHYTLSAEDLAMIERRRGDPNRLGFAVMVCYLRFPGRTLRQDEQPPMAMLAFIAEQLEIEATSFGDYAERDKTRREHLAEIGVWGAVEQKTGLRNVVKTGIFDAARIGFPADLGNC